MRCPNCNQDNLDTNTFCIYCGSSLEVGEEPPDVEAQPELPQELTLEFVQSEVEDLQTQVSELRATMASYGMRARQQGSQPTPQPQPVQRRAAAPQPALVGAGASGGVPPTRPPREMPWDKIQMDWEMILGGNWLARIGILAVVIGVGFFLKLAFDNNWIGETGRVVLGIFGGIGLLGFSEYVRSRYATYSQALAGGGVAVLYLSIFAAFSFYGLLGIYPAIGLLLLISVTSAALALRHNSTALAVIGILGAFSAPFILGSFGGSRDVQVALGGPGDIQVMVYVIIVNIGVLLLSTLRNWRWFTLLALVASLLSFGMWYASDGVEASLLASQGLLTIMFLIFVGATTLFHFVWRRAPRAFDQILMILNAAGYFGISYGLLWDDFRPWMGAFTLVMALFYGGIAFVAMKRSREQVYLSLMALGIALVFLTIAVPVQLGGPWVSVAWAVEGAVLIWLSFTLKMWQLRAFGIIATFLYTAWLLAVQTPVALLSDVRAFYNEYIVAYALIAGVTYLAAFVIWRNRTSIMEKESGLFPAFLTLGNVFLTVSVPIQVDGVWIAITWAVEAVALVWLGFRLRLYELRLFGIGVFAAMMVRLLAFDTSVDLQDFRMILNMRMLAFASGIAALYLTAFLVFKHRDRLIALERDIAMVALVVAANALTLWILSAEVIAIVDSGIIDVTGRTAYYTKSLILSLVWAVYASIGLVVGIARRWRMVRLASLGLLAIPILKLFLFDSFALEQGYRVAAFLGLGGILLVGGFLYQKYSVAIRGFLFEEGQTPSQ